MKKNDNKKMGTGEEYLLELISTNDTNFLRSTCLDLVVITGHMYRRIALHTYLHPIFFLAGFLTCYYFMK